MIVVDASIAFKWLVTEEGSDAAARLVAANELVAPSLLRAEVANALLKKVVRADIDSSGAVAALAALDSFIGTWVELDELTANAFAISVELLAVERDVRLVTADLRLRNRLAGSRFAFRLLDWP